MDDLRLLLASHDVRDAARTGDYGTVLRHVRHGRGLTQEQAGRLAGYSAATISRFETGARRLADVATLRHLAAVLEVAPETFGLSADIPESSRSPGGAAVPAGASLASVVTSTAQDGDEVRRRELLLGGLSAAVLLPAPRADAATGAAPARPGTAAGDGAGTLAALRDSISHALKAEGPAGGPLAREQLAVAVRFYDLNFSRFAPALLAVEVNRTRSLVGHMLRHTQPHSAGQDLCRSLGWLSALAGNLAFILADHTAALIHLGTSARLGTATGDDDLVCWSLGAQAMTASAGGRHAEALELARSANGYAHTPLRRAQILAWAELRSLAGLGDQHRADANRMMALAQQQMAADPHGERPGRFGFDVAELDLHLAEATLTLGRPARARAHALASAAHTAVGRPGWAAATLVLARSEAARGNHSDAAALAHHVLDIIPPATLRDTSRVRLRDLDADLFTGTMPSRAACGLRERLRTLPPLIPAGG
jgi:transcriptional regulator with XRE-family HTH domain